MEQKTNTWLINALLACVFISIAVSFFFIQKDYKFIVEVACDKRKKLVFRDCTNPDDCPKWTRLKRYSLNAEIL